MEFHNKVPLQDAPPYQSGGDGLYPSVPPPYPGEPQQAQQYMGPPVMGPTVMHTHVAPATVVTTMRPAIIIAPAMGSEPCRVTCKACHQQVITRIDRKPTLRTHLMALLLCVFGCWPCVCVPYCMDSCLNADHYCPNCNAYIGTYQN